MDQSTGWNAWFSCFSNYISCFYSLANQLALIISCIYYSDDGEGSLCGSPSNMIHTFECAFYQDNTSVDKNKIHGRKIPLTGIAL